MLSDEARAGALDAVKKKGTLVMTRESMSAVVADMGECAGEGACEVETARNIGATFVVTGDITKMGTGLALSMKLFDVKSGALLATDSIEEKNARALKASIRARTKALLADATIKPGITFCIPTSALLKDLRLSRRSPTRVPLYSDRGGTSRNMHGARFSLHCCVI
jgi:hypothetical protein